MSKLSILRGGCLPVVLALFQACGGSDGGGSSAATVKSGLPPSSTLGDLTSTEAARLCEATAAASEQALSSRDMCTFFAAAGNLTFDDAGNVTIDRAACEQERDACIQEEQQSQSTDGTTSCDGEQTVSALEGCEATVAEYESCMNATYAEARRIFAAIDCTTAPSQSDVENFDPNARPSQCDALEQKCPQVVGGLDGSDGAVPPISEPPTGDPPMEGPGCSNTCSDAADGFCDDGGEGSDTNLCEFGTDCTDCGSRATG